MANGNGNTNGRTITYDNGEKVAYVEWKTPMLPAPAEKRAAPLKPPQPEPRRKKKRSPEELMEWVTAAVLMGREMEFIMAETGLGWAETWKLRHEILLKAEQAVLDKLGEDERRRIENKLRTYYLKCIDDADADAEDAADRGEPRSRFHAKGLIAGKLLQDMLGFNAPTQSLNVNVAARLEDGERQKVLLADPRYRKLIQEREELTRELFANRPRDDSGRVRDARQQGQMEVPPASGLDEQGRDAGRVRRDPPPDDSRTTPDRQEHVLVEVVPGLVPGMVPGEEDHLG